MVSSDILGNLIIVLNMETQANVIDNLISDK